MNPTASGILRVVLEHIQTRNGSSGTDSQDTNCDFGGHTGAHRLLAGVAGFAVGTVFCCVCPSNYATGKEVPRSFRSRVVREGCNSSSKGQFGPHNMSGHMAMTASKHLIHVDVLKLGLAHWDSAAGRSVCWSSSNRFGYLFPKIPVIPSRDSTIQSFPCIASTCGLVS